MPVFGIKKGIIIKVYILIVIGILLLAYMYAETRFLAVKQYTVSIRNLPADFDGFTILHLSDLHSKQYGENQNKLLDLINKQQFDLVALTGDFVDRNNPVLTPTVQLIEGLKGFEIYFVPGNHEHWADFKEIRNVLFEHGVEVLDNSANRYARGQSHIWLLGVDDPYLGLARLDKALKDVADPSPLILLAHAPDIFPSAVREGIDLVLVGHTHGGQIRIPFLETLFAPSEYDYGMFVSDNTTMIVNGGLGESILPLRLNMPPEIVLVTLESL